MATNRLYSFRFPWDVRSTLESWRQKLSSPLNDDFDAVLAKLADRDRALEDHLNLGVSQGRLAYAISTSNQVIPDDTTADITGLSVTVAVPANRVLKITGQCILGVVTPMNLNAWINEDGSDVAAFGDLVPNAAVGSLEIIAHGAAIRTPAEGVHTYKLRATCAGTGDAVVGATTTAPAFILVEDIGPTNT